jgi:hypothetical protein
MLTEQLRTELESIINERYGPGETSLKRLSISAKRQRAIAKKYPERGSPSGAPKRFDPESGMPRHPKTGKTVFPTVPMQKKYELQKKKKTEVTPDERSMLGKIVTGEPKRRLRVVSPQAA